MIYTGALGERGDNQFRLRVLRGLLCKKPRSMDDHCSSYALLVTDSPLEMPSSRYTILHDSKLAFGFSFFPRALLLYPSSHPSLFHPVQSTQIIRRYARNLPAKLERIGTRPQSLS